MLHADARETFYFFLNWAVVFKQGQVPNKVRNTVSGINLVINNSHPTETLCGHTCSNLNNVLGYPALRLVCQVVTAQSLSPRIKTLVLNMNTVISITTMRCRFACGTTT